MQTNNSAPMNDYNALLHLILRGLANADAATIDNVFSCLVTAQNNLSMSTAEQTNGWTLTSEIVRKSARHSLNRAAQYLWGSYPPENVRVSDSWEYFLRS